MAYVYPVTYFGDRLIATGDATLSITSAAVLYGLSVYTVLPVTIAAETAGPSPSASATTTGAS